MTTSLAKCGASCIEVATRLRVKLQTLLVAGALAVCLTSSLYPGSRTLSATLNSRDVESFTTPMRLPKKSGLSATKRREKRAQAKRLAAQCAGR